MYLYLCFIHFLINLSCACQIMSSGIMASSIPTFLPCPPSHQIERLKVAFSYSNKNHRQILALAHCSQRRLYDSYLTNIPILMLQGVCRWEIWAGVCYTQVIWPNSVTCTGYREGPFSLDVTILTCRWYIRALLPAWSKLNIHTSGCLRNPPQTLVKYF